MKYRVIFANGKYYPEYKFLWLFWVTYLEYNAEYDIHFTIGFNTLSEAITFCEKREQKERAIVVWSRK